MDQVLFVFLAQVMKPVQLNLITQSLLEAVAVVELKVMEMLERLPVVEEDIENPLEQLLDVIQFHLKVLV
jgi:hypothetical protein